jgi:hypothetical protein
MHSFVTFSRACLHQENWAVGGGGGEGARKLGGDTGGGSTARERHVVGGVGAAVCIASVATGTSSMLSESLSSARAHFLPFC